MKSNIDVSVGVKAVSACLLGVASAYDGSHNLSLPVINRIKGLVVIPVCPESMGGLDTPRIPSEIQKDGITVLAKDGRDVTGCFASGAGIALEKAGEYGCVDAIMKENSPSCGSNHIYDGSFTGRLIEGEGIAAGLFRKNGMNVTNEK